MGKTAEDEKVKHDTDSMLFPSQAVIYSLPAIARKSHLCCIYRANLRRSEPGDGRQERKVGSGIEGREDSLSGKSICETQKQLILLHVSGFY